MDPRLDSTQHHYYTEARHFLSLLWKGLEFRPNSYLFDMDGAGHATLRVNRDIGYTKLSNGSTFLRSPTFANFISDQVDYKTPCNAYRYYRERQNSCVLLQCRTGY